jgi:hypothetical protein
MLPRRTVRKRCLVHIVTDPSLRSYRAVCRAFWCSPLIVLRTVDALSSHLEVHEGRWRQIRKRKPSDYQRAEAIKHRAAGETLAAIAKVVLSR